VTTAAAVEQLRRIVDELEVALGAELARELRDFRRALERLARRLAA
jgi:hypothetical protein